MSFLIEKVKDEGKYIEQLSIRHHDTSFDCFADHHLVPLDFIPIHEYIALEFDSCNGHVSHT